MSEQDAADADEDATAEEPRDEEPAPDAADDAGDAADETGGDAAEVAGGDGAGGSHAADEPRDGVAADEDDSGVDEALVDRVADSDPEDVAREIASLRTRVDGLEGRLDEREAEVDELTSKLKRKQADFQNYKKRVEERREAERRRAMADFVGRLLDVRDNLVRALEQDEDAGIRDGVEATLRQFDDVLQAEDVEAVEPDPGADVDPERHQVLARVDSGHPEGTIDEVHRPGYVMGEDVIREAQVTVSDGGSDDGEAEGDGGNGAPADGDAGDGDDGGEADDE